MSQKRTYEKLMQQPQQAPHRLDAKGRLVFEQVFTGHERGPSGYAAPPKKGSILYPLVWTLGNPARDTYDGKPCRVVKVVAGPFRGYEITAVLA